MVNVCEWKTLGVFFCNAEKLEVVFCVYFILSLVRTIVFVKKWIVPPAIFIKRDAQKCFKVCQVFCRCSIRKSLG